MKSKHTSRVEKLRREVIEQLNRHRRKLGFDEITEKEAPPKLHLIEFIYFAGLIVLLIYSSIHFL